MRKNKITQAEIKSVLHYDPDTGVFTWIATNNHIRIGQVAGTNGNRRYRRIEIKGIAYQAHRLAYIYVYGDIYIDQIDHINHIKTDNRIVNLRACSLIQNQRNRSLSTKNKTGFIGVRLRKGVYIASIRMLGKEIHLGRFNAISDAIEARKAANIKYGFHENHGLPEAARMSGTTKE